MSVLSKKVLHLLKQAKIMLDTVKKAVIGASGVVGVEAVDQVAQTIPESTGSLVELVIQIVIGISTIFGLFRNSKKPKKVKNTQKN